MIVQILKDGQKNLSILVKGIVERPFRPIPILDLSDRMTPSQGWKGVRLDSAVWVLEEKLTIHLWWEEEMKEDNLVFPMQSRNFIRFEDGVPSPRIEQKWGGKIWISADSIEKAYFFILDLDKQ
jgi:hypothetical protein